jgi:hypothetical protein
MDGRERGLDGYVLQIRFRRLQPLQPLLGSGNDDAALDRVHDAGGEAAKDLAHDPGLGLMGPALTPH